MQSSVDLRLFRGIHFFQSETANNDGSQSAHGNRTCKGGICPWLDFDPVVSDLAYEAGLLAVLGYL
jgi:hypothetical protein